jgi:predicted MFS family arabinose efflux permease
MGIVFISSMGESRMQAWRLPLTFFVAIILWCGGAKLISSNFGWSTAMWTVVGCGLLLLFLTIRRARISTREYQQFVDENGFREIVERQKHKSQQGGTSNGG